MENKRILILTANTGEGHNSASRALREALESRSCQCTVQDGLAFIPAAINSLVCRGHIFLYRRLPRLFGLGYRLSETHSRKQPFQKKLRTSLRKNKKLSAGMQRLLRFLQNEGFDAVICTHVFPARMLSILRMGGHISVPCFFLATDYTCSPGVNQLDMDAWLIPHEALLPQFAGRGIPEDKLIATVIPVCREFLPSMEKTELRSKLNLPFSRKIILLSCGSMGAGPMERLVRTLEPFLPEDALLAVMCGKNQVLAQKLQNTIHSDRILVKGFVERLSDYMEAADIYLTKPGGLSTTEALCKGVPLLLFNAVPGLETRNLEFLTQAGCAKSASDMRFLRNTLLENAE